jgi:hypothetical protein
MQMHGCSAEQSKEEVQAGCFGKGVRWDCIVRDGWMDGWMDGRVVAEGSGEREMRGGKGVGGGAPFMYIYFLSCVVICGNGDGIKQRTRSRSRSRSRRCFFVSFFCSPSVLKGQV